MVTEAPAVVAHVHAPGHQWSDRAERAGMGLCQGDLDMRGAAGLLELA